MSVTAPYPVIMCVRYNGKVEETLLQIDEAASMVQQVPSLHLFISHTFSCYEECSISPCLGSLCPN